MTAAPAKRAIIRDRQDGEQRAAIRRGERVLAWGDNSHSTKGPGGQSQGVSGGFSVGFSDSKEGARGPEGGCEGVLSWDPRHPLS